MKTNEERLFYLEHDVIPNLEYTIGWDATAMYGLTDEDWDFINKCLDTCENCGTYIGIGEGYTMELEDGDEQDCCDMCYSDFT